MKALAAIVVICVAVLLLSMTRGKHSLPPQSPSLSQTLRHTSRKQAAVSLPQPAHTHKPTVTVTEDLNAMPLNKYPPVVYRFEGLATCAHLPCPEAQVSVRVLTGLRVQTQVGVTDAAGRYSIPVTVSVPLYTPLEWTVEAHTGDYQQVQLTGRRIVTDKDKEDGKAVLQTALALL